MTHAERGHSEETFADSSEIVQGRSETPSKRIIEERAEATDPVIEEATQGQILSEYLKLPLAKISNQTELRAQFTENVEAREQASDDRRAVEEEWAAWVGCVSALTKRDRGENGELMVWNQYTRGLKEAEETLDLSTDRYQESVAQDFLPDLRYFQEHEDAASALSYRLAMIADQARATAWVRERSVAGLRRDAPPVIGATSERTDFLDKYPAPPDVVHEYEEPSDDYLEMLEADGEPAVGSDSTDSIPAARNAPRMSLGRRVYAAASRAGVALAELFKKAA